MKFCWSTIKVNNMEESLKFYKAIVGLKENRRFNAGPFHPNPHVKFFYVLDPNGLKIEFVEFTKKMSHRTSSMIHFHYKN